MAPKTFVLKTVMKIPLLPMTLRGHSPLNGMVATVSVETGKILDANEM